MDRDNQTVLSEFVLLGLSNSKNLQVLLFLIFLLLYLLIMSGNIVIQILITTDPHLHSPMYFLLANLSFVDIWLSSVTTPKMAIDFLREHKTISFEGCMTQIFAEHFFAAVEVIVLISMAYDRYVAICRPLHYPIIMNSKVCHLLVLSSWVTGFLSIFPPLMLGLKLEFCASKTVDHFLCDTSPVLQLSCTDTRFIEWMAFVIAIMTLIITLILVILSYTLIIKTILKFPSAQQRKKWVLGPDLPPVVTGYKDSRLDM